jgi:hypothetical protein
LPTQRKLSDCTETLTHTRIKVDDKRSLRWAVFLNPRRAAIEKIRVDGCLVTKSVAADWIVSKANCVDVVVELKGRDVGHAIQQVVATLRFWSKHAECKQKDHLAALIVCTQYPRDNTKIERARRQIAQQHHAPLHVKSRNLEYAFEALASFAEN